MRYSVHPPGTDYYCFCNLIRWYTGNHFHPSPTHKTEDPRPCERRLLTYIYRKKLQAALRRLRAANPINASRESVAVVGSGVTVSCILLKEG